MLPLRDIRYLPVSLLEDLERLFPAVPANPSKSVEELMFAGGQHHVVQFLRAAYERENGGS